MQLVVRAPCLLGGAPATAVLREYSPDAGGAWRVQPPTWPHRRQPDRRLQNGLRTGSTDGSDWARYH
eukprot:15443421-Alexandrium_andersonii.AAC.1